MSEEFCDSMDKIVESLVEVKLKSDDDFLKIKETLTRIGIASKLENTLYQSCHILSKENKTKFYICHFKELFMLDHRPTDFTEADVARRNTIVNMLRDWDWLRLLILIK